MTDVLTLPTKQLAGRPQAGIASASLLACLLWLSGCGDDGSPAATATTTNSSTDATVASSASMKPFQTLKGVTEFVGRVSPDLYVAVVRGEVDGQKAVTAYFCDGTTTAKWFDGLDDGTIPSRSGDGTLSYTFDGQKVTGTAQLDATRSVTFEATAVASSDASGAGFYVAWQGSDPTFGDRQWGGWIVLPDGTQRGALLLSGSLVKTAQLNVRTGLVTTSLGSTLVSHTDYIGAALGR